jgi:hypothetical protein
LDLPFHQFDSQKDDASFCSKCQTQTRFANWFAKPFCHDLDLAKQFAKSIWQTMWQLDLQIGLPNHFAGPRFA